MRTRAIPECFYQRLRFSRSRYRPLWCHWEQRFGGSRTEVGTFENHVRVTEKVRVCQKRSPGGAVGPTPNTPSVSEFQLQPPPPPVISCCSIIPNSLTFRYRLLTQVDLETGCVVSVVYCSAVCRCVLCCPLVHQIYRRETGLL